MPVLSCNHSLRPNPYYTDNLKAGTLYPLLHSLEQQGMVTSYDKNANGARVRKYYSITKKGRKLLADKKAE
ncbi:hypothetical protein CDQ83_18210 [Clostridium thermosuccinogenes]|nr:hypothetical protein CDQ83_18210 [Pseudoclostridium thermosuccinogenes]